MQINALDSKNKIHLKKHLKKGGVGFNIGAMLAGNMTAQFIGFLLAPIITRLYIPEHFGIMAIIISLVSMFTTIACMSYETAIVLPKNDDKAYNIVTICLIITFTITLILIVAVTFANEWFETLSKTKGIKLLFFFVPIGVLAHGFQNTFTFWFTRKKNFPLLAKMRFIIPFSASSIKIIFGFIVGSSPFWLITGDLSGILIVTLILTTIFVSNNRNQFTHSITKQSIKKVALEYRKFPKYDSITRFMNELSINLPSFLFAYYFSFEFVGFYSLASKMLKKPVQLVSNSINGVLLQHFSELQHKGKNQRANYVKSTLSLAATGIIPFTLIAIMGEWVFSFVFGAKWATAGVCAQYLSPWLFFLFINSPANQIILVKQKLRFKMVFQFTLLASRTIAILLGHWLSPNPIVAVAFFSSVGVIANSVILGYAYVLTVPDES